MSERLTAILVAIFAIAVVLAQIVFAGQALFHTWQYALALAVLAYIVISYAASAVRGQSDGGGRAFGVAMLGVLVIIADGLASGLLGPDTQRIVKAPGTIVPLPDIGAAAFFSNAGPDAIAGGTAQVTLRRRGKPETILRFGQRQFAGGSMLVLDPVPAAYVDAADSRGNHLTITQQTGGTFLSPVLLFRERQSIAGAMHPIDGFELPGVDRSVKVVYFAADDVATMHFPIPPQETGKPALLYDVFKGDRSLGISVAPSGDQITIAGVRLRATLGRYPALVIASVPAPAVLAGGLVLFVGGLSTTLRWRR